MQFINNFEYKDDEINNIKVGGGVDSKMGISYVKMEKAPKN